ncbi:hypothetical protein WAI453_000968 [Rhynchosporium graminicola]
MSQKISHDNQETLDYLEQEKYRRTAQRSGSQRVARRGRASPYWRFDDRMATELNNFDLNQFPIFTIDCIRPLYQKERWKRGLQNHNAKYPITGDMPGYSEADNPVVWNAIFPALRMASRFLDSAHFWPCWDALIPGQYNDIPSNNVPDPCKKEMYINYNLRVPAKAGNPDETKKLQETFLKICQKAELMFCSGRAPSGGLADGQRGYGCTQGSSHIFLIPYAERAIDLFRFAVTVIHETAHAVLQHFSTKLHYQSTQTLWLPVESSLYQLKSQLRLSGRTLMDIGNAAMSQENPA